MNEDDLISLATEPIESLADAWCLLNSWKWPAWLANAEQGKPSARRTDIMRWIEKRIGMRAVLRAWNRSMTEEHFDDFYRGCYEHDADAKIRYFNRLSRSLDTV